MIQGNGLALRRKYFDNILQEQANIPWLEILADHYINHHGTLIEKLTQIVNKKACVMHCVGFSPAGLDPIEKNYLTEVNRLRDMIKPAWISDHLSVSHINGVFYPELLPFPLNQTWLEHCCQRIDSLQKALQTPFIIENAVHYAIFKDNTLDEATFLNQLCQQTGCGILLDINNLYVNQENHGIDVCAYLHRLDKRHIKQIHLAGYSEQENFLIDTHSREVQAPVWQLYKEAITLFGPIPTCLEWDNQLPAWSTLLNQLAKINEVNYAVC